LQVPEQRTWGRVQVTEVVQAPATHVFPVGQTVPHLPQFLGSVLVLVQVPELEVWLATGLAAGANGQSPTKQSDPVLQTWPQ
jgi:hypothetical protein